MCCDNFLLPRIPDNYEYAKSCEMLKNHQSRHPINSPSDDVFFIFIAMRYPLYCCTKQCLGQSNGEFVHQTAEAKHGSNQGKQRTNEMQHDPISSRAPGPDPTWSLPLRLLISFSKRNRVLFVGRHDDQSERDYAHSHNACRCVGDARLTESPLARHRVCIDEECGDSHRRQDQVAVMVKTNPLSQHVGGLGVGVEEERDRHERKAHHGA